ncbi:MAG: ribokinase [Limnochordaceae bacterium]|nr:ribokinase [Limnochordaceae bacterium]
MPESVQTAAPPRILVVGSINQDVVVRVQHAPEAGETVLGSSLQRFPGGKGANQAVAAARLGASVTFLGNVGQDAAGDQLVQHLNEEGICTTAIGRCPDAPTGTAWIVVEDNGQNRIIVVPGANHALSPAQVEAAAEWFAWAQIVLIQLEIPLPTVTTALRVAAQHHCRVLLNPAPAPSGELLARYVHDWWPLVDLLVPNEPEALALASAAVPGLESAGVKGEVAAAAATSLLQQGVHQLVITAGEQGALVADRSFSTWVPAFPVRVVDTTAAGDAFCGGLAVALTRGESLAAAARYACAVAALSVTRAGAQPSLPTADEVSDFLRQHNVE